MLRFLFDRMENILRKGENAGAQHLFLFPQFQHFSPEEESGFKTLY